MDISRPTLIDFEIYRKSINYIPPEGSNSFYNIGSGDINILCISDDPEDIRFNLFTNTGNIRIGNGNFTISKNNSLYKEMTIIENTGIIIDKSLTIDNSIMEVHGKIIFEEGSTLNVTNGSRIIFYIDSVIDLLKNGNIKVDETSEIEIYGTVNVHLSNIDIIINNKNINIDSAATLNVKGINLGNRPISLTDYEFTLRNHIININTQGESNSEYGRLGYNWMDGTPASSSQVIKMIVLWGEAVLGDFKLPVLGLQNKVIDNKRLFQIY